MSERMRESLSALLDDEADELELQRVLSQIGDDQELRQTWRRYAAASAAVSGHQMEHLNLDISGRVREAIAREEGLAVPGKGRLSQRLLRPVASFAIAASVAAVVVVGGQQLAGLEGASGDVGEAVAGRVSPVGLVNSLGATSVQASFGTQPLPVLQPATRTAYQELARQRMRKYGQEHAEQAALNAPHGLIPFARVPEIRE